MTYDWIIIGAGPGGYEGAIRAAQLGEKVALIEARDVGGTCLNRGCIPTKALLHSAEAYASLGHMAALGIDVEKATFSLPRIYRRKEEVVETLRKGVEGLIVQNGITLYRGRGTILEKGKVQVGDDILEGARILIATGSNPGKIPLPGADLPGVATSDELLAAPLSGGSLVIIGGGVIGVEMASALAPFGVAVTIIEMADNILPQMDRDISQNAAMLLKRRGISVITGASVSRLSQGEGGLTCHYTAKGKEQEVAADQVLLAVGRKANTEGLFAGASPAMERGCILTGENHETSIPSIYAIGDVTGGLQLAHRASAQGIQCVELAAGVESHIRADTVPSCVYMNPEIAAVGITEEDARAEGLVPYTGKYLMGGNGRTMISMGDRGFVKVVFDKETDMLLGAHLMCQRATDMIGEFTYALAQGLTRQEMLSTLRPHPTYCEGITEALEAAGGMAIHQPPARK